MPPRKFASGDGRVTGSLHPLHARGRSSDVVRSRALRVSAALTVPASKRNHAHVDCARPHFLRKAMLCLAVLAFVELCSGVARAYPWMIRHDYTACAQCHVDPSGGGPLSPYGRAMGEVLLRTQYGEHANDEGAEPGPGGKFLWGVLPLPEWLDLGGSFRAMSLTQRIGDTPLAHQIVWMQSDLNATLNLGRWVASGSLGYEPKGGLMAALTRGSEENVVSRYHWVGYHLDEDGTMLVRAGRMNLPFGIRDIPSHARDPHDDPHQQRRRSAARCFLQLLGRESPRGGDGDPRQLSDPPDAYRERGYSGYLEWAPLTSLAAGISSRVAHVELDPQYLVPMWRHAHGVFGRWASPWRPLVLMSEIDFVLDSPKNMPRNQGAQAMLQVDLEPCRGFTTSCSVRVGDFGPRGSEAAYSGWATFAWFFASHVDVRIDGVFESVPTPVGRTGAQLLLAQFHVYL